MACVCAESKAALAETGSLRPWMARRVFSFCVPKVRSSYLSKCFVKRLGISPGGVLHLKEFERADKRGVPKRHVRLTLLSTGCLSSCLFFTGYGDK